MPKPRDRKTSLTPKKVEISKRRSRVRQMILTGYTSLMDIATRLGVCEATACGDVKAVMKEMAEENTRIAQGERDVRIKQLEFAAQESMNSFQRSKQNAEQVTTTYDPVQCRQCNGTGMKEGDDWCDTCGGDGYQLVESVTRRVTGQAGDSTHLREYRMAVVEAAKLKGLYPNPNDNHPKGRNRRGGGRRSQINILQVNLNDGGRYANVPRDVLLNAKEALLELQKHENGNGESRVIDTESEEVYNEGEEKKGE